MQMVPRNDFSLRGFHVLLVLFDVSGAEAPGTLLESNISRALQFPLILLDRTPPFAEWAGLKGFVRKRMPRSIFRSLTHRFLHTAKLCNRNRLWVVLLYYIFV